MGKIFTSARKITRPAIIFLACMLCLIIKGFGETEPNNSRETANLFTLNSSMTGSITQSDTSADFYKLIIGSEGKLVLTISSDAALCLGLTIQNETGTYNLYSNGSCGSTHSNTLTVNNIAAGIYYLWADNTGFGNYTITNAFTAASLTNDSEPNNTFDASKTFDVNTTKTGHLGYGDSRIALDDVDCYKIITTGDGRLTLNLTSDQSLCINMRIYNASGTRTLFQNGVCPDSHTNPLEINLVAGTYYIELSAANMGYGSYTLQNTLSVPGNANDNEPNNTNATAETFSTNNKTGHLGYRTGPDSNEIDVVDCYKITTTSSTNLTVNLSKDGTLCVSLRLLNSAGTQLTTNGSCNNSTPANTMTQNNLPAGTYYLEATGTGYGSYMLTTTFTSVTGIDQLTEDCLKIFPNPAKNELTIFSGDLIEAEYQILDVSGKVILSNHLSWSKQYSTIDISALKTGMYILEVKGKKTYMEKFFKE